MPIEITAAFIEIQQKDPFFRCHLDQVPFLFFFREFKHAQNNSSIFMIKLFGVMSCIHKMVPRSHFCLVL